MKITQEAVAGTLESSDVMIRVTPNQSGIVLEINSSVKKQFGEAIEKTVRETLNQLNVIDVHLIVDDKGALDCVLKARLQAVLLRASNTQSLLPWEALL